MKIRIGEILKNEKNVLLDVSPEYEKIVKELSKDGKHNLLRALIISQTGHNYRDFLIFVLRNMKNLDEELIVKKWNDNDFEVDINSFEDLFNNEKEWKLFLEYEPNLKNTFEYDEKKFGTLFNDKLSKIFYPSRKKKDIIIRRLIAKYLGRIDELDDLRILILHFIAAQLLISWEASCLYLGKMILERWNIKKMKEWFCDVFLIYTE
jgi:hypothetical protein